MPIVKTANVVTESVPLDAARAGRTGVRRSDQHNLCSADDPLKQLSWNLTGVTTNTTITLTPPSASGAVGLGNVLQYAAPVTTDTVTMAAGVTELIIEPAGTIAALTVVLPTAPPDATIIRFCSTQIVSTLTLTAGGSDTVVTDTTSLAVDTSIKYIYRASTSKWYKQK